MTTQATRRSPITTVHLVYPHAPRISTPDAIGRNLGARLGQRYRIIYHDWDSRYVIEPSANAALVGHPHPLPWTVFRRSVRSRGWGRVLMLAPYNEDVAQGAFEDSIIRDCDLFLAITGPYWFSRVGQSSFAHWAPKMVHLDLAVDRQDFPAIKTTFNPPGKRRFAYIGHTARAKNVDYLGEIARRTPETEFAWIGTGGRQIPGLTALGPQDFASAAGRDVVASFDFLITVGYADANPTTILEAMSWGLIPVCTPQSGYEGVPGIANVPLGDAIAAAKVIQNLQRASDDELRGMQVRNWEMLDRHYTWDRFTKQVVNSIESASTPPLGRESRWCRAQLWWAAQTSWHTSVASYVLRRVRRRLRAMTVLR